MTYKPIIQTKILCMTCEEPVDDVQGMKPFSQKYDICLKNDNSEEVIALGTSLPLFPHYRNKSVNIQLSLSINNIRNIKYRIETNK